MYKRIFSTFLLFLLLTGCARTTAVPAPVEEASPTPEAVSTNWWQEAVFYEIFVRSFYDTDGDGIGDLNGVAQKLDYLESLGITALWLMPIHPSPSYHGYDVLDYYDVNPQYGTLQDFKNLLEQAHKRDIRIIIDLVLNHTSDQHPFFQSAAADVDSQYRDWYIWSDASQSNSWYSAGEGYYYALFCSCMPDLNYNNPAVTTEMEKVTAFWLDMGVDGFRVDATKHLIEDGEKVENTPATHEWYKGFYKTYKEQNSQAYAIGEVFGAGSSVVKSYTGDQLDQIFNFEMSSGFVNSVNGGASSGVVSAIKFAQQDMPDFNFATFLTNHDQNRVMSVFHGNVDKAKLASFLMLTSPGTPYIYYGEEIGMQGQKPDEDIRLPMQWNADSFSGFSTATPWRNASSDYAQVNVQAQNEDPNSLLQHYRTLIALRKEHAALHGNELVLVDSHNSGVFSALRISADEIMLVVANLTDQPITDYSLTLDQIVWQGNAQTAIMVFGREEASDFDGSGSSSYQPFETLKPYGSYIIQFIPQ